MVGRRDSGRRLRGRHLRGRRSLGKWGEGLAAWYLRLRGYRILRRDLDTPLAQVDILARKGRTLVLCEVKSRRGERYEAVVGSAQRERLQRAGRWLLSRYEKRRRAGAYSLRYDLVVVRFPRRWGLPRIRHHENAFS